MLLLENPEEFSPLSVLQISKFFFHVINPFTISVMLFRFHNLIQNCFVSFASDFFFIYPCALSTNLLVEFSFVVLECPFLYCLTLSRYLLESPFFCQYHLDYFFLLCCRTRWLSVWDLFPPLNSCAFYLPKQFR